MAKDTTNQAEPTLPLVWRFVTQLGTCLKGISDPRAARGVRYALWQILGLVVLAKLAGQDTPYGIAQWVAFRKDGLAPIFGLKKGRTPHHTTFHRLLRQLPAEEVEAAVRCFALQLAQAEEEERVAWRLLAFDGKTLRGTRLADGTSLHLLGAYWPALGGSLGQVPVAQRKENEIVQAPRLLASLPLKGKILMGDALHTQRALSHWLRQQKAHFLWIAKANQGRLHDQLRAYFRWLEQTGRFLRLDPPQWEEAQTQDRGHGRQEKRRILVSAEALEGIDWPGATRAFCVIYQREASGEEGVHEERRYGLTSLPPEEADAGALLAMVRLYWHIENRLHYRRDVTFHEDALRTRWATLGQVMAALNNALITLFHRLNFTNHAQARRWFEAHSQQVAWALRLALQP